MEEKLFELAKEVTKQAYCKYSNLNVGAALLTDKDEIVTGVNVENESYGLSNCAERTAIFTAVTAGMEKVKMIAVTCQQIPDIMPCGACRQVMKQFSDKNTKIIAGNPKYYHPENSKEKAEGEKEFIVYSMEDLLPSFFTLDEYLVVKK